MQPKNVIGKLVIGAVALAMFGVSAGLTATPAWAVERDEFKDECEAGGGTFAEGKQTVYCDHQIHGGEDDGKTITVFCSKSTNYCGTVVNKPAPSQQFENATPLVPVQGGRPRRR